jgi:hypothetical protein
VDYRIVCRSHFLQLNGRYAQRLMIHVISAHYRKPGCCYPFVIQLSGFQKMECSLQEATKYSIYSSVMYHRWGLALYPMCSYIYLLIKEHKVICIDQQKNILFFNITSVLIASPDGEPLKQGIYSRLRQ